MHRVAEEIVDGAAELPNHLETAFGSIAVEVLVHLDALNQQLIIKEDIPAILRFLSTPKGMEKEAWIEWRNYWNGFDFETRKAVLKGNDFYGL